MNLASAWDAVYKFVPLVPGIMALAGRSLGRSFRLEFRILERLASRSLSLYTTVRGQIFPPNVKRLGQTGHSPSALTNRPELIFKELARTWLTRP